MSASAGGLIEVEGNFEFTPERMDRFNKILAKYETKRSALLPVLYVAQEQFGFLSKGAMRYVANLLELPEALVFEAVTFYSMYKKKDMGKHCLQVCNNVTCSLMGSEKIIEVIKDELKIGFGDVTADNVFSLIPVQCLGSCDTAPVVQINDDYHENVTPQMMRTFIHDLKAGKTLPAQGSAK